MKNFIYGYDIFSYQPNIFFDHKKKISSLFGFILSISIITAIFIIGILFFKQCSDRLIYRLTSSDIFIPASTYYSLKNISVNFEIKDGGGKTYPEFERYFTIQYVNGQQINGQTTEMKKCKMSTLGFKEKKNETESFCLPLRDSNTTRYGTGNVPSISILTCLNETDSMIASNPSSDLKTEEQRKTGCYPKEFIDRRLGQRGMYIYLTFWDRSINHSSTDNIFPYQVNSLTLRISTDLFSRYQLKFKPIFYNLDLGFIFENIIKDEAYSYTGYDMQIALISKDIVSPKIGQIDIVLDNFTTTYNRSFIKLQEVSANIGGIAKFFYLCGQLIIFLYNENNFYNLLALKLLNNNNKENFQNLIEESELNFKNNLKIDADYRLTNEDLISNIFNCTIHQGLTFVKKSINISNLNLNNQNSGETKFKILKKKFNELNTELISKNSSNFILNYFYPSKVMKKKKKMINSILSYDNLVSSLIELLQFKDFLVSENQLIYFGNQKFDIEEINTDINNTIKINIIEESIPKKMYFNNYTTS